MCVCGGGGGDMCPQQKGSPSHRLQVQHPVLGLLQQAHELGGEQPEALLVSAGGLRLQRVPRGARVSPGRLQLHHHRGGGEVVVVVVGGQPGVQQLAAAKEGWGRGVLRLRPTRFGAPGSGGSRPTGRLKELVRWPREV